MAAGRIHQLNVSPGGVPKRPIESATVTPLGLEGDDHRDQKGHGGPERALCFYSLEQIEGLRAEGHPVQPGWMGENVTTIGIDLTGVEPGDRFLLGESVLVEVTRHTTPCKNIVDAFSDGDFTRVSQKLHPGWSRFYVQIVECGVIRRGDAVRRLTD
ncbi:MAG TPA: MOSC domain-containing protein [Chloroflexota bacterium]|nr:MOSC domain-containing protein [Chloroflexota bacterium]